MKAAEPKRKWIDALLENLVIKIEHVHVLVRTRGRPASRGGLDKTPPPLLHLHLTDILVDSADDKWQSIGVEELLARRKTQHAQSVAAGLGAVELIDVRKLVRVGGISVGLGLAVDADAWFGVTLADVGAQLPPALQTTRVQPLLALSLGLRAELRRNARNEPPSRSLFCVV